VRPRSPSEGALEEGGVFTGGCQELPDEVESARLGAELALSAGSGAWGNAAGEPDSAASWVAGCVAVCAASVPEAVKKTERTMPAAEDFGQRA
jgi:hypothetical protein